MTAKLARDHQPDTEPISPGAGSEAHAVLTGEPARPHGCLTALVIGIALLVVGILGCGWLFTSLPILPLSEAVQTACYGIILIAPFGLVALLLRQKRFGLWRGVALALVLAGGHAALAGAALAVHRSLPWPGLPSYLAPLLSLTYGSAIIALRRRHFLASPAPGPLLLGLGLGLLASWSWVAVGALGTPTEALTAILEALASGLISAVLISSLFSYDQDLLARGPLRSALLVGFSFWALEYGLLAPRGYWLQGLIVSTGLIPLGFIAGVLMTLDERPEPRRMWWAALVYFVVIFFIPFAWTEGFEGEWMPQEAASAWSWGALFSLVTGIILALLVVVARRGLVRVGRRPVLAGLFSLSSVTAVAFAYVGLGQPGTQPETFFVVMSEQADTTFALDIDNRDERVRAVYRALTEHASRTQAELRTILDARGVRYTPYYIVNGIEVEGNVLLRREIAGRPDVVRTLHSPRARPLPRMLSWFERSLGDLLFAITPDDTYVPGELAEGVDQVDAERVWEEFGVSGEGIIVGSADSGIDWTHPALRSQYLGAQGAHDYTWFDPWYDTEEPTDTGGHGTHTLGTILGQGGIGLAPGARWIACRNLARNLGNPPLYLDCMQFLFAPFPRGGDPFTDGDPTRGAHLTNNSWGCPPQEGCDGITLSIAVQHLRNAGQLFVVGAGNEGPGCETVSPPANADAALSVGAVDRNGEIALFSSRGPALDHGEPGVKPDVVAPGAVDLVSFPVVGIPSSVPGGYARLEGTSMATPHVTGLVALMWSANPSLIGDIEATEQIIIETAHPHPALDPCGAGDSGRNNIYGFGLIDAFQAVRMALGAR